MSKCVQGHSVFITDRGGSQRRFQPVELSLINWSRVRSGVSDARIVIQGDACSRQAEFLSSIEPHRDELVIFRGRQRVWEGPVHRVAWGADTVEVAARDCVEYLNARPLSRVWDNTGDKVTEVTTRIGDIIDFEMSNPMTFTDRDGNPVTLPAWEALTPPANVLPHMVVHHFANEARTAALTQPVQMTVGEHLENLSRYQGISYTMVGRALHIWDVSRPLGRGRTLTENDFFGETIVTAYGAEHATAAFVTTEDSRYGAAGESDPYYGPWTRVSPVYDEEGTAPPTNAELASQAQRNLSGRNPVPVVVRVPDNSSVRLSEGFSVDDIVPGTYFPLLATLNARNMSQEQKIDSMHVTETADGEDVQVTLVPTTAPDEEV